LRKIMALVLILTVAVVFTACGDNNEDQTTLDPLSTGYYSPGISATQQGNNSGAVGSTYVLTTNQSKTVPALANITTKFVPGAVQNPGVSGQQTSSTTNPYNNITYNTSGVITAPSYTTTRTVPTTWQTIPSTTIPVSPVVPTTASTTKAQSPVTTTQPTTKAEPEGVYVVANDWGTDTQGRIFATIEPDGWGGKIKSNSMRVAVYIDGVEMDEGAMLQISSATDGDGRQYVYLNMNDYEIDTSGSTVSFTIPEGFLENKTATKYNYAYEVVI